MDFKIGLMIPADMVLLILPFPMLFFVQNAEQLITQSEAQIRKSVVQLLVIKGGMLRKSDCECNAVGLFHGKCFCFLALGNDRFQMVVCRVFL